PAKQTDEVKVPAGLAPHLHEHWRGLNAATRPVAQSMPESTTSHFEQKSRDAVAAIQSNVDREEAAKFLDRGKAWGWELVYRSIESFIQRRKQQRWLAGR